MAKTGGVEKSQKIRCMIRVGEKTMGWMCSWKQGLEMIISLDWESMSKFISIYLNLKHHFN